MVADYGDKIVETDEQKIERLTNYIEYLKCKVKKSEKELEELEKWKDYYANHI